MSFAEGSCWSIDIDGHIPIATIIVKDAPTAADALAMREAFIEYARSIGKRPWAMLSDLRKMTLATQDGQRQWIDNMVNLFEEHGMRRWAVLNHKTDAALQAAIVAQSSKIQSITVVTFEEEEAQRWAASVTLL